MLISKRAVDLSLSFLSKIYLLLVKIETYFFKKFSFLVYKPKAKVISVGNLSLGGTGKTPTILHLLSDPKRPSNLVLLTRGYKSRWEYSFYIVQGSHPQTLDLTDEVLLINQSYPNIPILIGKNRAHSAKMAEYLFKPDIIILDDGFQYRRIRHDLDIVLIDTTSDINKFEIIPKGILREPLARLVEADIIIFTRCELSNEHKIKQLNNIVKSYLKPNTKIIYVRTKAKCVINPEGKIESLSQLPKKVIAFSALGNNEAFYKQLEKLGVDILYHKQFRDHYKIKLKDLEELRAKSTNHLDNRFQRSIPMICTTKDRIKLSQQICEKFNIWTLETELETINGQPIYSELEELGINLWK